MYLINKVGLEEIRQQLIAKLKSNGYDWQLDEFIGSREQDRLLNAYASDLEDVINDPGMAEAIWEVELSEHTTKSGHVEFLSVGQVSIWEESKC